MFIHSGFYQDTFIYLHKTLLLYLCFVYMWGCECPVGTHYDACVDVREQFASISFLFPTPLIEFRLLDMAASGLPYWDFCQPSWNTFDHVTTLYPFLFFSTHYCASLLHWVPFFFHVFLFCCWWPRNFIGIFNNKNSRPGGGGAHL